MTSPRVSVIIPVKDRAALLEGTFDGLDRQTFADFEVVVVDDGSSDGSAGCAERRGARVLRRAGGGAVAARLAGVEVARGEILAFTDSDCIPQPGWLEAGVAAIDAGADVVQGLTRPARDPRPLERSLWSVKDDGLFATCNVLYRRTAYDAAGGFDPQAAGLGFRPGDRLQGLGFAEDTLLGWRVRRAGTARFVPDAVVEHHVFEVDVADSLRRAWTTGAFAGLMEEVPELRTLLHDEVVKGRRARLPIYALAVVAVSGRRGRRLVPLVAAWWVLGRFRAIRRNEPSRRRAAAVLPADLAVEAVTAAALVWASAQRRRMML